MHRKSSKLFALESGVLIHIKDLNVVDFPVLHSLTDWEYSKKRIESSCALGISKIKINQTKTNQIKQTVCGRYVHGKNKENLIH